jgi:predicted KAP-like P-loop ATPase
MNIIDLIKKIFFFLIAICILLAFFQGIEKFLGNNEIFSWFWSVKPLFVLDIFIILAAVFYTILKIYEYKIDSPNKSFSLFIILVILFYSYERFISSYFIFTPFKISSYIRMDIKIFDILYWFALLDSLLYLKYLKSEDNLMQHENKIIEDAPINNKNDDKLDGLFNIPAQKISKILQENKFRNSFTIGLNGEWGDGKTSVFNFVKQEIKNKEDFIVVDYNPWLGYDKKALVRDFFNSLSENLGSNFSSELTNYTNEILNNSGDNSFIKIIKSFFKQQNESLNSIFDRINNKIGYLDKKIVIFVDDVDRLDKEEIFELLKLIRKTANFQNTFFVVAYDRKYVNNSIKDQSGTSVIKYLDKIINAEISLPYFDKYLLKNYFIENLRKSIPANYHYKITHFIKIYEKDPLVLDLGFGQQDLFLYWLNNFREIKKIINAIVINYNEIYSQVNFVDAIYLEILKLKHPYIYLLLFSKQTELFVINQSAFCYDLAPLDRVKSSNRNIEKFFTQKKNEREGFLHNPETKKDYTVFEFYLEQYVSENAINDIEKEKIIDLVSRLFYKADDSNSIFSRVGQDPEDSLSVKYVTKFERYFSHTIFKVNIAENEFENFLELKIKELKSRIELWISQGKANDLSYRLNHNFFFKNKQQYKNTLTASFIMSSLSEGVINFEQVIAKMFGRNLYPDIFSNKDEACEYFIELFSSEYGTSLYKSNLLRELNRRNLKRPVDDQEKFPLSISQSNHLSHSYIHEALINFKKFDAQFWSLYFVSQELLPDFSYKPFKDINQIIIEKLTNDFELINFLKSLIHYNDYGYESKIKESVIANVFGSYENFENNILNKQCTDSYFLKFKEYYEKSKINNWEFIEFEYEFLKESIEQNQ